MKDDLFYTVNERKINFYWLVCGSLLAVYLGWLIAVKGITIASVLMLLPFIVGFVVLVFSYPKAGYIATIIFCYMQAGLARQFDGVPFGLGQDGLMILTWLALIFHRGEKFRFRHLKNDLVFISVAWFLLTVLEIGNPERPSIDGWIYEMRSTTLYWVLSVPLAFMVFNKKSDLDFFFHLVIIISLISALYGIKQLYIGVSEAERAWLDAGAKRTHILFGKLRVFSFYTDAGQFGAAQAIMALMCIILAVGPHPKKMKIFYLISGFIILYGMLISGTRGALFGLLGGGFVFLILSKKINILIIGGVIGAMFYGGLKYTSIGSGNGQIQRLRSALNPDNPSLKVRLVNQERLKNYLSTKPFGYGIGTIGIWGIKYNKKIPINSIPPDSYFVKVWAEYGIIGLVIWLSMMMYILGKSVGIVWNTRDPVLQNKLAALCAGFAGVLLCSYGNEVINQMPTSIVTYTSWPLLWLSTRWDTPLVPKKTSADEEIKLLT
jgi:hypothetical protein